MRVLMLDTLQEVELDEIEAVQRIDARMAVEAPVGSNLETRNFSRAEIAPVFRVSQQAPESAMLDRSANTMTKPRPQPRPVPKPEKRGAGRGKRG